MRFFRTIYVLSITTFTISLQGQASGEAAICDCLERKFASVGLDFFKGIDETRSDLIKQGIITEDFASVINRLKEVETEGMLKVRRSYENPALEELGFVGIEKCVKMYHATTTDTAILAAYQTFVELNALENESDLNHGMMLLAKTLNTFIRPEYEEYRLWRSTAYLFLYHFTQPRS